MGTFRQPSVPGTPGLTLTRKVGEALYIGRDITVTVTEMRSGQVKLRIAAPATVAVSRSEFDFESHLAHQERREQGGR